MRCSSSRTVRVQRALTAASGSEGGGAGASVPPSVTFKEPAEIAGTWRGRLSGRSGYAIAGRWIGGTPPIPGIPRRGMLEAWAASAKDGSLECLVQVPIRVIP